MDINEKPSELLLVYQKLAFQNQEKEKRAAELIIANIERDFQKVEREKRAAELILANIERDFQDGEREKRAAELVIANMERDFQNEEKEKRAAELMIANKELVIQNEEKEKRAAELIIANNELIFQNHEKEKRAAELVIANKELLFQNEEKEKRAAELVIANKELVFQNREKEKRAAELVIANIELASQNQERELNKKKDEFIGLASHELKTPLTSINAYLQFLQRSLITDEKNHQLIAKALQQVGKLSGLISDLLDVSKIASGKLPLLPSKFNMTELLQEAVEIIKCGNIKHLIEVNYQDEEISLVADPQRIEQVIINLLSNAMKYSPDADRVIVKVSQTETDVVLTVQDFGIGIKDDHHSRIFSRFYRVEDMAPHISGLGIGLYISDDIISRHGGTLIVESKFGVGSIFSFKLPKGLAVSQ
jgi:signal transduction histidine kinase